MKIALFRSTTHNLAQLPGPRASWGDFQLLERVGHGGYGEVYRAWDPHLQREVALKLLIDARNDEETYQTILHEARTVANVRHPNIVSVFGVDRRDGRVGFWTDFIHGQTLSSLLQTQGPFASREAALIGIDICKALGAVHGAGLVHGDIKAQNVMREEGGRIVLIDFGQSELLNRRVSGGSPGYMAPELIQGQQASVATDVYATGVLLFHLVTNGFPDKPEARLLDHRPDVLDRFSRIVESAIQEDPKKRPATVGVLAASLSEAIAPPPAPARKLPGVRLLGTLAVILAVVIIPLVVKRQRVPGPDVQDLYAQAEKLLVRYDKPGNIPKAVALFERVLGRDPQFALAEAGIGRAKFLQYRNDFRPDTLQSAREAIKRALDLDRNLAPAYVTRAMIYSKTGEKALAQQDVERALTLDSRSADAYAAQADVFSAEGRSADVEPSLQKAADLSPNDWRWPLRMGLADLDRGNPQEAITHLQRAAELAPDSAWVQLDLGNAYLAMDRFDEAQQALQRSIDWQPGFAAYSTLGALLLLKGDYPGAIQASQKAISLNEADYATWGNLADAYQWAGDRAPAVEAFHKAITLAEKQREETPEDTELLTLLSGYYATLRDEQHALPLMRTLAVLAPGVPDIAFSVGESYELLGQREEAIQWITKAIAAGYPAQNLRRSPELAALLRDKRVALLVPVSRPQMLDKKKQTR